MSWIRGIASRIPIINRAVGPSSGRKRSRDVLIEEDSIPLENVHEEEERRPVQEAWIRTRDEAPKRLRFDEQVIRHSPRVWDEDDDAHFYNPPPSTARKRRSTPYPRRRYYEEEDDIEPFANTTPFSIRRTEEISSGRRFSELGPYPLVQSASKRRASESVLFSPSSSATSTRRPDSAKIARKILDTLAEISAPRDQSIIEPVPFLSLDVAPASPVIMPQEDTKIQDESEDDEQGEFTFGKVPRSEIPTTSGIVSPHFLFASAIDDDFEDDESEDDEEVVILDKAIPKEKEKIVPAPASNKPFTFMDTKSPTQSGWGDMFKPPPGSWKCEQCLVRNEAKAEKCVSCEAPRPNMQQKQPSSAGATPFSKKKESNNDDSSTIKSVSFADTNGGNTSIKSGAFLFSPSTQKSSREEEIPQQKIQVSFGDEKNKSSFEQIAKATDGTPIFTFGATEPNQGAFRFGGSTPAPAGTEEKKKDITTTTAPSFGLSTNKIVSFSETSSAPAPAAPQNRAPFTFGATSSAVIAPAPSIAQADDKEVKPSIINFGASTANNNNGTTSFSFGSGVSTNNIPTPAESKSAFSFSTTGTTSTAFNATTTAKNDIAIGNESKPTNDFGSNNINTVPIFGNASEKSSLFSFGSTTHATAPAPAASATTPLFSFGSSGQSTNKISGKEDKPGSFSFGQQQSVVPAFGSATSNPPAGNTSGFSFGQTPSTPFTTNAQTTDAAPPPPPEMDMATSPPGSGFHGGAAPPQQSSGSIFGGSTTPFSSTNTNAPPTFGASQLAAPQSTSVVPGNFTFGASQLISGNVFPASGLGSTLNTQDNTTGNFAGFAPATQAPSVGTGTAGFNIGAADPKKSKRRIVRAKRPPSAR
uniref:RanBP2-type domain-containing protein n=1 Tax=Aureoumbra lagunensis TaxID=44058 RepID=A0A7S3K3X3_9STRA|mmetsp:Transcript_6681/g.9342  ORF Transcript_6681/g.9342 Transcript_6681/m.9342 type:complete len:869 (-) Transcript_6681:237-2843(-)